MERTCERCGSAFKPRQKNRANRFCSAACYHASGRPLRKQSTVGTRMLRVPNHPIAPPSGTVAVSRLVLYDKVGAGPQACEWCGLTVRWRPGDAVAADSLVADHFDWNQQNNAPENLVPSCRVCNAHRIKSGGRAPIQEDELYVTRPNGSRHRAIRKDCKFCGSPFVAMLAQIKAGKAHYCSRGCARRAFYANR